MKWALLGKWDAARELLRDLKERGLTPSALDWIRSIFEWISHARWKRGWRLPIGPEIDEARFVSEKARPEVG
jgi:pentatricopeptide repeat protein